MNIRLANNSDLPEIVSIYNSTIPSRQVTADLHPVTIESKDEWFHAHNPSKSPLWVAEEDKKIAAWLSLQPFYGREAYSHTAEISIYVHPDFRGKGMGNTLIQFAIDQCESLDIHTLLGYIFAHNTPSLRLFEKFGFSVWGHFPKIAKLDDTERDLIVLGKRVR